MSRLYYFIANTEHFTLASMVLKNQLDCSIEKYTNDSSQFKHFMPSFFALPVESYIALTIRHFNYRFSQSVYVSMLRRSVITD